MSQEVILERIRARRVEHVLLTGGEPLLQRGTLPLIERLNQEGYRVSIETHGEVSIEAASQGARIIMDIKTPGSGMCRMGFKKNLPFLKPSDEIKFVITSRKDYDWAKAIILEGALPTNEILLSPAVPAKGSPGTFEGVSARDLADWILQDQLKVRFQLQLHKVLWGADTKGV